MGSGEACDLRAESSSPQQTHRLDSAVQCVCDTGSSCNESRSQISDIQLNNSSVS